mmetsp:Transcript_16253/g.42981  ORF Transcript_16253/g.42981 Transcript_16253/m.42981 type:complete len:97 (+) Transcript_16253:138-428(+)
MAENFTEAEHDKVVTDKILKQMSLTEVSLSIPKILYGIEHWGGPGEVKRFLAALPLPLRLMMVHKWVPAYKRRWSCRKWPRISRRRSTTRWSRTRS